MRADYLTIFFLGFILYSAAGFETGDEIRIMVNKVSPFANPTESYKYYYLPFCQPEEPQEESQSLGEKLSGNRKMSSLYKTKFLQSENRQLICTKEFSKEDLENFKRRVEQNYLFEMFVENIAVGDYLGFFQEDRIFLSTHIYFKIWYDSLTGDIVTAEISTSDVDAIDITDPQGAVEVPFYYTVKYMASHSGEKKYPNKGNDTYFPNELHVSSLLNAFSMTVLLVVCAFYVVTSTTKGDSKAADLEDKSSDESNWKSIRNEVFRSPDQKSLLCAAVGGGVQLILMALLILLLGAMGMYESHRGSLVTTGVVLYSFTAIIAGYVSSKIYKQLGGKSWPVNILLTAALFPVQLFAMTFFLNNIAWASSLTSALPVTSILFVIFMWALVTLPLTIFGGLTGRMRSEGSIVDSAEKLKNSKALPRLSIINTPLVSILIGGLVPFSAIYLELFYVFSSIWGHVIYAMWGMLFIMLALMINVTACMSMILTQFQLNALDYRWWWRSFFYGGAGAFYIFAYGVYFYCQQSEMFGFIQTVYYFGYTIIFCSAIFLMLGSVSFLGGFAFVKHIYERTKVD